MSTMHEVDRVASMCYNSVADQDSEHGGFLFRSLHVLTQPNIVVSKAPVLSVDLVLSWSAVQGIDGAGVLP